MNSTLRAQSSLIRLSGGNYIDTSGKIDPACIDLGIYYFQTASKYPISSDSLLKKMTAAWGQETALAGQSGWITFQFMIDCEGRLIRNVRVVQTDEKFKPIEFPLEGIHKLYQFILGLDGWKHATLPSHVTHPYHSFFSFKINHGKVERIIP